MADQQTATSVAPEAGQNKTRLYEAMFLVSQSEAADFGSLISHVDEILEKAGVQTIALKKWDERRLAYEIDKQKRGVYLLCYFVADGGAVGIIENECNLSERIMRVMIVRADHMSVEQAAIHDDREGLQVEAKLKADQSQEEERQSSGARLGAPEQQAAAAPVSEPAPEEAGEGAGNVPEAQASETSEG